jgi:hypothetical protein
MIQIKRRQFFQGAGAAVATLLQENIPIETIARITEFTIEPTQAIQADLTTWLDSQG